MGIIVFMKTYTLNDYVYAESEVLRAHRYGNLSEQIKATEEKQKVLDGLARQRQVAQVLNNENKLK